MDQQMYEDGGGPAEMTVGSHLQQALLQRQQLQQQQQHGQKMDTQQGPPPQMSLASQQQQHQQRMQYQQQPPPMQPNSGASDGGGGPLRPMIQQHQPPQSRPYPPPNAGRPAPSTSAGPAQPPPPPVTATPPSVKHEPSQPLQHFDPPGSAAARPAIAPRPLPGISGPVQVVVQQASQGGPRVPIVDKDRLDSITQEVESTMVLEDAARDALLEFTEEFVDDMVDKLCRLVMHKRKDPLHINRGDVEVVLHTAYNMPMVPGAPPVFGATAAAGGLFGGSASAGAASSKNGVHQQRLALIKKTLKKI